MEVDIPRGWKARDYQKPLCDYLDAGGKHAEVIWHRRAGKDEVALHHAACQMMDREAGYWHMLPQSNQIRKAIWESVNPHTGVRRIREAFPPDLFSYRESDMFIKSKVNNSTWQCLGSDNYEGAIGSPPAGIVYSEWAQANPSARGYLRPIIAENNGYQLFITTPRGKNHAYRTFQAAKKNPGAFAEILTVDDTGMLSKEELAAELKEYCSTYGDDFGRALYHQEYFCDFSAAILGAYYSTEFVELDKRGGICAVPHDPKYPVYVAMDIGRTDDTAIYWYQVVGGEVHILEYYAANGHDIAHFAGQILGRKVYIDIVHGELKVSYGDTIPELEHRREYVYKTIWLPHDAKQKTLASSKSTREQFCAVFGWAAVQIVPMLSVEDGIRAVRLLFPRLWIDEGVDCEHEGQNGVEPLRQYQREWDDEKKMFRDKPLHDWTSHPADAIRYLAIAWHEDRPKPEDKGIHFNKHIDGQNTFNEMLELVGKRRAGGE